jgi:hypothetical protein
VRNLFDRFLSIEEFRLLLGKGKDPELRTVILVLCMTTLGRGSS